LLDDLEQLKADGLTSATVAINFCRRLIQPLQDRAHLAIEYWGQSDPTQVTECKVSKEEMMAHVKQHLLRAYPQQGGPQGTRGVQPLRPGKSSTLIFIRVRSVQVYIFGVGSN
jgi:hypothetical protein